MCVSSGRAITPAALSCRRVVSLSSVSRGADLLFLRCEAPTLPNNRWRQARCFRMAVRRPPTAPTSLYCLKKELLDYNYNIFILHNIISWYSSSLHHQLIINLLNHNLYPGLFLSFFKLDLICNLGITWTFIILHELRSYYYQIIHQMLIVVLFKTPDEI